MMIMKKKKGFTLVEVTMLLLVLSIILAAAAPLITKKIKNLPFKSSHGTYICYYDSNDQLHERMVNNGRQIILDRQVDSCNFQPPSKANLFKIVMVGGGSGGYNYGKAWSEDNITTTRFWLDIGYSSGTEEERKLTPEDLSDALGGQDVYKLTGYRKSDPGQDLVFNYAMMDDVTYSFADHVKERLDKLKSDMDIMPLKDKLELELILNNGPSAEYITSVQNKLDIKKAELFNGINGKDGIKYATNEAMDTYRDAFDAIIDNELLYSYNGFSPFKNWVEKVGRPVLKRSDPKKTTIKGESGGTNYNAILHYNVANLQEVENKDTYEASIVSQYKAYNPINVRHDETNYSKEQSKSIEDVQLDKEYTGDRGNSLGYYTCWSEDYRNCLDEKHSSNEHTSTGGRGARFILDSLGRLDKGYAGDEEPKDSYKPELKTSTGENASTREPSLLIKTNIKKRKYNIGNPGTAGQVSTPQYTNNLGQHCVITPGLGGQAYDDMKQDEQHGQMLSREINGAVGGETSIVCYSDNTRNVNKIVYNASVGGGVLKGEYYQDEYILTLDKAGQNHVTNVKPGSSNYIVNNNFWARLVNNIDLPTDVGAGGDSPIINDYCTMASGWQEYTRLINYLQDSTFEGEDDLAGEDTYRYKIVSHNNGAGALLNNYEDPDEIKKCEKFDSDGYVKIHRDKDTNDLAREATNGKGGGVIITW